MEKPWISIGEVATRSGVASSALRFYEREGLIAGRRSDGGHRQYPRDALRRIAFIRAAQAVGLSLPEIARALASLPQQRTPTKADWSRLARDWGPRLDAQIAALQRLRLKLDSCIGCGCLSLKACTLYNSGDAAKALGAGARYLLEIAPALTGQARQVRELERITQRQPSRATVKRSAGALPGSAANPPRKRRGQDTPRQGV